jgi:hypothetical protein
MIDMSGLLLHGSLVIDIASTMYFGFGGPE